MMIRELQLFIAILELVYFCKGPTGRGQTRGRSYIMNGKHYQSLELESAAYSGVEKGQDISIKAKKDTGEKAHQMPVTNLPLRSNSNEIQNAMLVHVKTLSQILIRKRDNPRTFCPVLEIKTNWPISGHRLCEKDKLGSFLRLSKFDVLKAKVSHNSIFINSIL